VRGVAFEYRAKGHYEQWRNRWDAAIVIGSFVPSLLWGVAFANILRGVPIDAHKEYTGGFFNLLNPYALLGGVTVVLLFLTHGAIYIALKTDGPIRERARGLGLQIGLGAALAAVLFLLWTQIMTGNVGSAVFYVLAAGALVGALGALLKAREGWAFIGTFACLALAVGGLFVALFPDVMPSSTSALFNLTTSNASSTHYTLMVMTIVAVIMTPIVLAYQAWTYWVFRKRISVHHIPQERLEAPVG
jgi:cytochrome d ubiquinol oxidase subunit II